MTYHELTDERDQKVGIIRLQIEMLQAQIKRIDLEHSAQLAELQRTCTHRYPNGKSGSDNGFMYASCNICGEFDI